MKVLGFKEETKGWWIALEFNEKTPDKKHIQQAEFFPKIDHEKAMAKFENNHLNTVHNYGEITVKGFIRYIPQEDKPKISDSLQWVRQMGKETGTFDSRRVEFERISIMGHKTELEKKYPKQYIKTKSGWVPSLLKSYFQQLEKAQKDLEMEKKFNEELREGFKTGTAFEVLRKWTVKTVLPFGFKEEKEYEVLEIEAMPNYSEASGDTYKSTQGVFDYGKIRAS